MADANFNKDDKVLFIWMGEEKIGKIDFLDIEKGFCNILSVDDYDGELNLHMFVPLSKVKPLLF